MTHSSAGGQERHNSGPNAMPASVRATRVLLYVVAGLGLITAIGTFVYAGQDARAAGEALYTALPGIASFVLALRIRSGGRVLRRLVIALQIVYILLALADLGAGNPAFVFGLAFPIVILILVTRSAARQYFEGSAKPA